MNMVNPFKVTPLQNSWDVVTPQHCKDRICCGVKQGIGIGKWRHKVARSEVSPLDPQKLSELNVCLRILGGGSDASDVLVAVTVPDSLKQLVRPAPAIYDAFATTLVTRYILSSLNPPTVILVLHMQECWRMSV